MTATNAPNQTALHVQQSREMVMPFHPLRLKHPTVVNPCENLLNSMSLPCKTSLCRRLLPSHDLRVCNFQPQNWAPCMAPLGEPSALLRPISAILSVGICASLRTITSAGERVSHARCPKVRPFRPQKAHARAAAHGLQLPGPVLRRAPVRPGPADSEIRQPFRFRLT